MKYKLVILCMLVLSAMLLVGCEEHTSASVGEQAGSDEEIDVGLTQEEIDQLARDLEGLEYSDTSGLGE